MARQSTAPAQRQLTLTEELERLEQSITLTLQEIDHNFSRAHRIVTSSILPVVEQYAEHSRHVWEGSKFWKQFFEASANVSLSGYEEPPEDEGDEEEETTVTLETSAADDGNDVDIDNGTPSSYSSAPRGEGDAGEEGASDFATPRKKTSGHPDASSLSSPDYSTPRQDHTVTGAAAGRYASPYETLRREVQGGAGAGVGSSSSGQDAAPPSSTSFYPSTPRAQTYTHETGTPQTATAKKHRTPGGGRGGDTNANQDVLLHRVLDRNYRVQATPHAAPSLPGPYSTKKRTGGGGAGAGAAAPTTPGTARRNRVSALDLDSSPLEEAPRFSSDFLQQSPGKRVPGVSVLATPGKANTTKDVRAKKGETPGKKTLPTGAFSDHGEEYAEDDDDDDDDFDGLPEGMSPPKTMQFYIPQSKLLKTPAKEASRQIVQDLLLTAGGPLSDEDDTDEPLGVQMPEESPSVVGGMSAGKKGVDEDSF